jgi:two-component system LytT family sensor kinase
MQRWSAWARRSAWYVAAWTPLVLIYALLIGASSGVSVRAAVEAAISTVALAAVLGVGVIWLSQRWSWPTRPTVRFFVVHVGMALLYAGAWDAAIVLGIRQGEADWASVGRVVAPWIHWQTFEGVLIYFALSGVAWARQSTARAREQDARLDRLDALRARAELEAVRGRLDPHFLFNTLHSVTVLIRHDPAAAEQAVERLSALLRYVLDAKQGGRDEVLLADEVAFTDAYLALEALRFGDRLRVDRQISPDALDQSVPSFVLQSLVENAVKHGIAPRASGGTVRLGGRLDAQMLVLEVRDDGLGVSGADDTRSHGIGLDALRQRLAARYGGAATVDVRTAPGEGYAISVRLPAGPRT